MGAGAAINAADSTWKNTALHKAANCGHASCLAALVAAGADLAARDKHDRTPMHLAACNAHRKCIKLLMAAGASAAATDDEGSTPISILIKDGHGEAAEMLNTLAGLTLTGMNGCREQVDMKRSAASCCVVLCCAGMLCCTLNNVGLQCPLPRPAPALSRPH